MPHPKATPHKAYHSAIPASAHNPAPPPTAPPHTATHPHPHHPDAHSVDLPPVDYPVEYASVGANAGGKWKWIHHAEDAGWLMTGWLMTGAIIDGVTLV